MIDWHKIPNAIANQNTLAEQSSHAIMVTDMAGIILMANTSAARLLRYDTLEGVNIRDIAPPPFVALFNPEFMEKGYGAVVRHYLRRDGSRVWMTAQLNLLKDAAGAPWGVFIYMYDSTTERELRAEVEHLSAHLRGVVSSLQQALNKGKALPPEVTPAEKEIAALVKDGLTCKEIAAVRGMGVKSVENVRVALRRKLNIDRHTHLRTVLNEYGDL